MINILSGLDKSFTYKIDYGLYYHCNEVDESLNLNGNIPSYDYMTSSNEYRDGIVQHF